MIMKLIVVLKIKEITYQIAIHLISSNLFVYFSHIMSGHINLQRQKIILKICKPDIVIILNGYNIFRTGLEFTLGSSHLLHVNCMIYLIKLYLILLHSRGMSKAESEFFHFQALCAAFCAALCPDNIAGVAVRLKKELKVYEANIRSQIIMGVYR